MKLSLNLLVFVVALPQFVFGVGSIQQKKADAPPIYTTQATTVEKVTLPAGTAVSVRLDKRYNIDELIIGQKLNATVEYDIVVDGKVVVKAGAAARVEVTKYSKRKLFGKKAFVELTPISTETVDGQSLPLAGNAFFKANKSRSFWAILLGVVGAFFASLFGFYYLNEHSDLNRDYQDEVVDNRYDFKFKDYRKLRNNDGISSNNHYLVDYMLIVIAGVLTTIGGVFVRSKKIYTPNDSLSSRTASERVIEVE